MTRAVVMIVRAKQAAENGVDYSPRTGATCPSCGKKARIYSTKPWEGTARIRYHRCENTACVLHALGVTIKSVEVDVVDPNGANISFKE